MAPPNPMVSGSGDAPPFAPSTGTATLDAHGNAPSRELVATLVVAAAATALATIVRALLTPTLGTELPYLTFFAAVMGAAWFGGLRGGVIATVLSVFASQYFILAPSQDVRLSPGANIVGIVGFVIVGVCITLFAEAMHRARRAVISQNGRLAEEIAARQQSERAAHAQGEQLRLTLMSIGDAVIVTDRMGRVDTMNQVAEELTGWHSADARTKDLEQVVRLIDSESRQPIASPMRRALAAGSIAQLPSSTILLHPDGRELPVDDSVAPIRNAAGEVVGSILIFRDVTERWNATATLRENEAELSDFFDNANVGMHLVSKDGLILRANAEELRMLGYRREEYVGHHISEFHADPQVVHDILAAMETRTVLRARPARMRCRNGQVKEMLLSSSVRSGEKGSLYTRCITLDVNDRAEADRTKSLLASVVESSDDAIVSKTLQGVITSWNRGAERLFGHTAAEAIGRSITFIIPPELHDEEVRILAQIGRGEVVLPFETTRRKKGGSLVSVSVTVSPIKDASGRVIGASKVARDISARIAMEEELRETGRRKDMFLATLAHELRNPLAPMRHALPLMAAIEPDSPRTAHVVGILTRQLDHMVRLIDDLMDLSRINRDKLDLQRSQVRIDALVRQAVETVRPMLDAARHTLCVELPDEAIYLDVDPIRMTQVLTNLLSNAAKFTDAGGLIAITGAVVGTTLRLQVRDNGIGISPDRVEEVFEMFVQGHARPEDSRGGLGIGLTLVRRIVELHGGRISIHSMGRGSGTTATLDLPLGADTIAPTDAEGGAHLRPPLEGRRVLVVDDNRDSADTLAMLLVLKGASVATAYDGESAIALFQQRPAHVVLLDLGMPKISGFDVCRAIRAHAGGPEAIIIALTGWGQEQDRRRSHAAGFDGHLVKPVDLTTLFNQLVEGTATRNVS